MEKLCLIDIFSRGRFPKMGRSISSVKKTNKRTLTLMQATLSLSTFSSELFPAPVLRTSFSSPHQEGNLVNMSCETTLPSEKPGLQLYFSFYVGNKTLMSRTTSSEYQTFITKKEDRRLYWCEAATGDGNLIKRSPELELPVLGE